MIGYEPTIAGREVVRLLLEDDGVAIVRHPADGRPWVRYLKRGEK